MEIKEKFKIIRLRQAVSAVIFKDNKFLLVSGKGWPADSWCFPQGGLIDEETHFEAVKRELKEELGTDKIEIVGRSEVEHSYLFPQNIAKKKGCEGQFQTIWFVKFFGEIEEINFQDAEIASHKWFNRNEIISNMAFPEQKETFEKVMKEFDRLKEDAIF